jgi:DtxR family transcriptional regulator, Mn-dependent transcriptional regulator
MIDRIAARLGHPDRCPHGWPVDTRFEQAENRELAPLSDLEPGTSAEIVRLAEHDGEILHSYYEEGLVPGTRIELRMVERDSDRYTVRLNGDERALSEKAAAGLFVRPA